MSEPKHVSARSKLVPRLALVFGILVVGLFGLWFSKTEAFKLATTHQPERFTELYFVDPNHLPKAVAVGKTYTSSFAIVNHEAASKTYTYQITIAYPGSPAKQQIEQVRLLDGQRITSHFDYTIPEAGQTATITISLPEVKQSIHFKVES